VGEKTTLMIVQIKRNLIRNADENQIILAFAITLSIAVLMLTMVYFQKKVKRKN
jgi:ABC-type sugar transport system permease subunit